MNRIVEMFLIFSCAFTAVFAPAPKPKPIPPPVEMQVENGEFVMTWGPSTETMSLGKDSSYSWGPNWKGSYSWDRKTRTFYVSETIHGAPNHFTWQVSLDKNGKGISTGKDFAGISVYIYLAKPELLPAPKITD